MPTWPGGERLLVDLYRVDRYIRFQGLLVRFTRKKSREKKGRGYGGRFHRDELRPAWRSSRSGTWQHRFDAEKKYV